MLISIRHSQYSDQSIYWQKYRDTMLAGKDFVQAYLKRVSSREDDTDYAERLAISYCPAHAKAAIKEIKNSIFERMGDITRKGGTESYQAAVAYGVDEARHSMNAFIGDKVLTELLTIGKVGIFVDREEIDEGATLLETREKWPYAYIYQAEDILSWAYERGGELAAVLLRDTEDEIDEATGLNKGQVTTFRYMYKSDAGVTIEKRDSEDKILTTATLKMSRLPFHILELSDSLLTDVADYQIALMNVASSDLMYAIKSNFPFYIEQYNPAMEFALANKPGESEVKVGTSHGRRYPQNTEAPSFINPSPEPLRASMEKQEQLKTEIRQLVHLALTNVKPTRASADSKEKDNQGLESGLAYIGMELEHAERWLADIWSEYEGETPDAVIFYPDKYSLRSDEDRRAEAKELGELIPKIPSLTFQRELAKRIVDVTIGHKTDHETLAKIKREIDSAKIIAIDPEVIRSDAEAGLVSNDTASKARLYPDGEAEKAAKDHEERAARVVLAQVQAKGAATPIDAAAAKDEKQTSQDPALSADMKKGVPS